MGSMNVDIPLGHTSKVTGYPPIDDYALIGDCRSAGLISRDGSLDWLCFPRFDSPSIFAALLDAKDGGRFCIRPTGEFLSERRYLPYTNVLETTFRCPNGAFVLRDLMSVSSGASFLLTFSASLYLTAVATNVSAGVSYGVSNVLW